MKPFRHILITALLTLFAFGAVLYSSCKNKCGSTTCQNGGTCDANVCICPEGYSGNACQTGWSTAILGTYNCTRGTCVPGVTGVNTWQSAITTDATNGGYTIDISNFDNSANTGGDIIAIAIVDSEINGIQSITISPAAGAYGVEATGTFNVDSNIVRLTFTEGGSVGGSGGFTCNMVMTKI